MDGNVGWVASWAVSLLKAGGPSLSAPCPGSGTQNRVGTSQKQGPALRVPTSEAAVVLPPLLILQAERAKICNEANSIPGQMHKGTESAVLG